MKISIIHNYKYINSSQKGETVVLPKEGLEEEET